MENGADLRQSPRFGHLREVPPEEVLSRLNSGASDSSWTATRVGGDGGYPNGGIWRVTSDQRALSWPPGVIVKRTGAAHLGTFRVWQHRTDPSDPQWWGREAEFYLSDLASTGWTDDVRTPWCYVDDHEDCRDLWLEEVDGIPATLGVCRRAVVGLAHWQVAHERSTHPWLSRNWISTHVERQGLNNERTLAHAGWSTAIAGGLDPALRDRVPRRTTDSGEISRTLAGLPQALTNHDCHENNFGTVDGQVVLIDWAYIGWGPIGHDAGHLALSLAAAGRIDLSTAWQVLEDGYCEGLAAAGWAGDLDVVRRSMRVSNQLRMGWWLDHLLQNAPQLPGSALAAASETLSFLFDLD